jgi:hypothetical protein
VRTLILAALTALALALVPFVQAAPALRDQVARDLATLDRLGKEAYLDGLFARIDLEVSKRWGHAPPPPVRKHVRALEAYLASLSGPQLAQALRETRAWLDGARPSGIRHAAPSWAERFFGDTRVVRNFLVTTASLSALGTALGIAAATASAAAIPPAVAAIIPLIALLNRG